MCDPSLVTSISETILRLSSRSKGSFENPSIVGLGQCIK